MTDEAHSQPPVRIRPVGDQGILVEFGDRIDEAIHGRVLSFDAALRAAAFQGFTESVPAYASVFVGYDPLITDRERAEAHARHLLRALHPVAKPARVVEVQVCYEEPFAPDLAAVAERLGLSADAVIAAHLAGDYRVFMYGFAPGYAYLGGVPPRLHVPRKSAPVRDVPAGSVLIAGPQCLVSTITMPTGWWIIGRSPTRILAPDAEHPFLFDVGDRVRFTRIDRATFERQIGREAA
jgi:inhibitor of KinA